VAKDGRVLGLIHLKDIVKGGIRDRFGELRRMSIRTVMITGDNPMTAAAIAAESGVDDFLAQATPEDKLTLIRNEQANGKLVAKIIAMLAAANLDPAANEHPEKLDLDRRPNRHIAFGTGIHFCLGHQLARIEGKCALEALFKYWPRLELAVEDSQVRWRERPGLRAIASLPVLAQPRDWVPTWPFEAFPLVSLDARGYP
jgi:hypothetical protein